MQTLITADGKNVIVDDEIEKRLAAHPGVRELLPEAFSKLTIGEESEHGALRIKKEVDLGRIIGKSGLVDTLDVDLDSPVYFAYRIERKFPSHVALDADGMDCSTVAISLNKKDDASEWKLTTAFVGRNAPNEPFYYFDKQSWFYRDEAQFNTSLDFWMKHALIVEEGVTGEPYTSTWRKELEKFKDQAAL